MTTEHAEEDKANERAAPIVSLDAGMFSQLLRGLADALVIADSEGTIVFWNPAAERLFGWPESEAVGKSLDLIIPERLRTRHWDGYRRVMKTGHTDYGSRLLEVPALHRDGHTLSIAFTVTLVVSPGERRPEAIAAVLRDDTTRRLEVRGLRDRLAALEADLRLPIEHVSNEQEDDERHDSDRSA